MLVGSRTGMMRLLAVILTSLVDGVVEPLTPTGVVDDSRALPLRVVVGVVPRGRTLTEPGGRPTGRGVTPRGCTLTDPGGRPTGRGVMPRMFVIGVGVPRVPSGLGGRCNCAGRGIGGRVTAARAAVGIRVMGVICSLVGGGVFGFGGRSVTLTSIAGSLRPSGVL